MPIKFDRSLLPHAPNLHFEQALWKTGIEHVARIDEVGRGALAGPVYVGVVILPNRSDLTKVLHGVRDSKLLSAKARECWVEIISQVALSCQVGYSTSEEIDGLGIVPSTRLAAMRAIAQLNPPPQHLLIDWISIPGAGLPETSLPKGDMRSLSIACASILAKLRRDEQLQELDETYPGYGFSSNKGYGTASHRAAISELGPCAIHRRSFSPMRSN